MLLVNQLLTSRRLGQIATLRRRRAPQATNRYLYQQQRPHTTRRHKHAVSRGTIKCRVSIVLIIIPERVVVVLDHLALSAHPLPPLSSP